jgi:glycerophosphoryl diester phosphodiesterase
VSGVRELDNLREPASGEGFSNRFLDALRAPRTRPLLIAHRGDSARAPENTLEAALSGWDQGADAWELDVRLTRDGVAIAIHDESLTRTTNVANRFARDPRAERGYLVADFDFDEIRTLDAGSWFRPRAEEPRLPEASRSRSEPRPHQADMFSPGQTLVPSLGECLALTARCDWLVNVELKPTAGQGVRLLEVVLGEIAAIGIYHRTLISSFDHSLVARASRSTPRGATAVLSKAPLYRVDHYVANVVGADCYVGSLEALGVGVGWDGRGLDESPLSSQDGELSVLGRLGFPVLAFTVNDSRSGGLAVRLARAGISGIFSDDPGGVRRLFESSPY